MRITRLLIVNVLALVAVLHFTSFFSKDNSVGLSDILASNKFFTGSLVHESIDTVSPQMYHPSLSYGIDSSIDPCDDFYQYVNGGWRRVTVLPQTKDNDKNFHLITGIHTAIPNLYKRLATIIDSAMGVSNELEDPTLRVVKVFYESCLVADSLEADPFKRLRKSSTPVVDSSRKELCLQRIFKHLGGAVGELFVEKLRNSSSAVRMDIIQSEIMKEAMARIASNELLSIEQKKKASESLARLKLRVGIPEEIIDYTGLSLSKTNYHKNIEDIRDYSHLRWIKSIGSIPKDKWAYGLIRANANYIPNQHAIEIPPVWFFPPFFYEDKEDALNFAAVGWVIAHEIYHSIATSIDMTAGRMAEAVRGFTVITSSLGSLDGWDTDGHRTRVEDLADMGGARAAYAAWKATLTSQSGTKVQTSTDSIEGFTPDQRFFIAMGRLWRAKWEGSPPMGSHSAPFARVNATVMQMPEFAKVFGCKAGDRMYLEPDKISQIW